MQWLGYYTQHSRGVTDGKLRLYVVVEVIGEGLTAQNWESAFCCVGCKYDSILIRFPMLQVATSRHNDDALFI